MGSWKRLDFHLGKVGSCPGPKTMKKQVVLHHYLILWSCYVTIAHGDTTFIKYVASPEGAV